MKKFVVEYEVPYVHLVRVGIEAESELIAAHECGDSPFVRKALLQSALEDAHAALPHLSDSHSATAKSAEKATAVIYLSGGVVQWVSSDRPMRYLVLDADIDGTEPMEVTMENGDIAQVLPTETVFADHQPDWVAKLLVAVEGR